MALTLNVPAKVTHKQLGEALAVLGLDAARCRSLVVHADDRAMHVTYATDDTDGMRTAVFVQVEIPVAG